MTLSSSTSSCQVLARQACITTPDQLLCLKLDTLEPWPLPQLQTVTLSLSLGEQAQLEMMTWGYVPLVPMREN